MRDIENSKRYDTMKKLFVSLLLVMFVIPISFLNAQPIGFEPRVPIKNLYFGVKGGVNATGVRYSGKRLNTDNEKEPYSFVNPSTLYKGDIVSCLVEGITVERTLHNFTYGLEGVVIGLNALSRDENEVHAKQDSALLVDLRIPIRVRFLEYSACSPFIVIAPNAGTYLYGRSVWYDRNIEWGFKNTRTYHFSVYAGIGMDVKIPFDTYEAKLRVECGWNQGVMNLNSNSETGFRRLEGWEATIGISFPLFSNPSYSWMM